MAFRLGVINKLSRKQGRERERKKGGERGDRQREEKERRGKRREKGEWRKTKYSED